MGKGLNGKNNIIFFTIFGYLENDSVLNYNTTVKERQSANVYRKERRKKDEDSKWERESGGN